MTSEKINSRVEYIDLLKCIGMYIIVFGHIHTSFGWMTLPLHAFAVPLFFFLSGLTFKRSKFPQFSDFAKHRAKSLLLPYFIFSILTWALWAVFRRMTDSSTDIWPPFLQIFLVQGSGGFLVHNVPLWFVPCLFVTEMIYYYIGKLCDRKAILTSLACSALGLWMMDGALSEFFSLLPWCAESALVAISFYCFGNILSKHYTYKELEQLIIRHKWQSLIVAILLYAALEFLAMANGHVSLGTDMAGNYPGLLVFNALTGIASMVIFAVLICSVNLKGKVSSAIMKFNLWFGRNSFNIMATHVPVKGILMVVVCRMLHVEESFAKNDAVCSIVVFLVTCAVCSILSVGINRLKVRDKVVADKLFGKGRQ